MPPSLRWRAAWAPLRLRWHEWMDRLCTGPGRQDPIYEHRRVPMLLLGHALLAALSLPWAIRFSTDGRHGLAMVDVSLLLSCLLTFTLLLRGRLTLATALHLLSCWVACTALAVAVDVPTAAAPRVLHLFLVPLGAMAHFMLKYDAPRLCRALPALCFISFGLLAASGNNQFGMPQVMPDAQRIPGGWANVIGAALGLYGVLHLMFREARASLAQELDFARAIEAGELAFHLQPQCSAEGRVVGAEALMRWHHPRRGLIAPAQFIPMAERSGLIVPAGERQLADVCALLAHWRGTAGLAGLSVAVNLSPRQLGEREAMQAVLRCIEAAAPAPGTLKLELTESALLDSLAQLSAELALLRQRGVRIALDDFGTGFSSLNYLKKLPLDQLKIDQSFVRELPDEQRALRITHTLIELGRELGLEIVAEGVETEPQAACLARLGCQVYQGYLFSRPLPPAEFERWVLEVQSGQRGLPGLALPAPRQQAACV